MQSVVSSALKAGGGLVSQAASAANPIGMALEVVSKGVSIYSVVQNEQIKRGIAQLQTLGMANLALTGVGIGVSIISHKLLADKLTAIQQTLKGMDEKVDRIAQAIGQLEMRPVWEDLTDLNAIVEMADYAWASSNAEQQWERCAQELHILKNRFLTQAVALVENNEQIAAVSFIDAYSLASSNQISCRLALGDDDPARQLADDFEKGIQRVTSMIGAPEFLRAGLQKARLQPGSREYRAALEQGQRAAIDQADQLREREAAAQSLPITLRALADRDVSGRDWLEQARNETDAPVLMLAGSKPVAEDGPTES